MNSVFDHKTLAEDVTIAKDAVVGFLKSFGPAPRSAGLAEDLKDRFMMNMVEMGPLKIIKTLVVLIVTAIIFFAVFLHADTFFKVVSVAVVVVFYGWMFSGEIMDDLGKGAASLPQKGLAAINFALKFVEPPKPK